MVTSFVSVVLSSFFAFTSSIFGLVFWQYIQLFGPTNQPDVASLCKARLCLGTAVSGTASSWASLRATFFLFQLYCGCSPCGSVTHTEADLLKKNSFISTPPFCYSRPPHFFDHSSLPFNQDLLTAYPSTLISSMQVSNAIRYKYSSFRCFYTFKSVNKLLLVFSSFSLENFSILSSNWVSKLGKHCLFPSCLKVQTFCFSNSRVAVLLELPSWKILQRKTVASAVSQLSSSWELNKGSWASIPDRFHSPFLPSAVKSHRSKAVTLWFTLVLILTPSVGCFFVSFFSFHLQKLISSFVSTVIFLKW